jgi:hypothetical protein
MKLRNIKKEKERVEVYYKQILKLANCLHIMATDTYFTIVFKAILHPCI